MSPPPSTTHRIPTTLIIDFYDSYTRNLLSLFSQLDSSTWNKDCWQERVVVVNVDSLTWEQFTTEILPHVDCIILGPGPGSPHKQEDFSWPTRLIQEFGQVLPILGLCLGHQGLATAFGGQVVRAPAPKHGQVSQIRHHASQPFFNLIPSPFGATQFNSLVVSSEGLPSDLEAIAWAQSEGEECIMALRHRSRPLWGVQFHPESIASTNGALLLSNFLSLALAHHASSDRPTSPSLPPHILSLSTSCDRTHPITNGHANGNGLRASRWELRTIKLGDGNGRLPQDVFEQIVKSQGTLGEVWLDSARPTVSPQHSHLFNPSFTWSYNRAQHIVTNRSDVVSSISIPPSTTFFNSLSSTQSTLHRLTRIIEPDSPSLPIGFVGSFGYEMKAVSLPHCKTSDTDQSDAEFAFASAVVSYEHATGLWQVSGLVRLEGWLGDEIECEKEMQCRFGLDEVEWSEYSRKIQTYFSSPCTPSDTKLFAIHSPLSADDLTSDLSESDYKPAIESARTSIIAGDAYELCLTTQFRATLPSTLASDPYPLYRSLRQSNPAPYSAYFNLPQSNLAILSSSPERYMRITKEGEVEMKPIKGTVRRSSDPIEDERRKDELAKDEKEIAENLMIVDLCRNDLLAFCEVESVLVPRLMVVETYETVHQLVTSICGQLLPMIDPFEAICRAFPPGSMTGAPKLRSVQLLEELERHQRRGVYAGVFGYVAVDGTTDFAVVIRTMVIRANQLQLGGGGAITHLSDPNKEWVEVLVKIDAVIRESI